MKSDHYQQESGKARQVDKRQALVSIAMLRVEMDEWRRDYLEYLGPFVGSVLQHHKARRVTPEQVKLELQEQFGLAIPAPMVKQYLVRLAKKGLVRREEREFIPEEIPVTDIDSKKHIARQNINNVLSALTAYSRDKFRIEWTSEVALNVFLSYLNQFSVEGLALFGHDPILPEVHPDKRDLYIVNSFVNHAHQKGSELFESVVTLVRSQMLTNAFLCPDLHSLEEKYNKVDFYLDTPIILLLLGLEGKEKSVVIEEMMTLVHNLGGRFFVFNKTIDEIQSVFDAVLDSLKRPDRHSAVLFHARRTGMAYSDLLLVKELLDSRLRDKKIRIRNTPLYNEEYQIDERALGSYIEHEFWVTKEKAMEHDVNCIRSIYVLRRGGAFKKIENSRAIFVTTNAALVRAVASYGKREEGMSSRGISPAITDYSLSNLAWLKSPVQSDWPQKEVLALCHAALSPTESVWRKYVAETEKLRNQGEITPEMHALMRAHYIDEDLMDATQGVEEYLDTETVRQVAKKLEQDASKGWRQIAENEKARLDSVAQQLAEVNLWREKNCYFHC